MLDKTRSMNSITHQVENCPVVDDTGLNDFQKAPLEGARAIEKVGIERFRLPMKFVVDSEVLHHDVEASIFVSLSEGKTGVNMSRLPMILQRESLKSSVDTHFPQNFLGLLRDELRDYDSEPLIENSYMKLSFSLAQKQKSLKSDNWGWQYYPCTLEASQNKNGETTLNLGIRYEYSSTCPCSLSMSKQYEREYQEGLTQEGSGVATAHAQRSVAHLNVFLKKNEWLEFSDLVSLLRIALPTETQSIVKRIDEQAFAILNGENPMFVEHAIRNVEELLYKHPKIEDWKLKVEHLESLHSHNAVAYSTRKS